MQIRSTRHNKTGRARDQGPVRRSGKESPGLGTVDRNHRPSFWV